LYTDWSCEVLAFGLTNGPSNGCGHGHGKFLEIIHNISEMVQDRDMVTMED